MFIRAGPTANHHLTTHLFLGLGPAVEAFKQRPTPSASCHRLLLPLTLTLYRAERTRRLEPHASRLTRTHAPTLTSAGPFQSVKPSTVSSTPCPCRSTNSPATGRSAAARPPPSHQTGVCSLPHAPRIHHSPRAAPWEFIIDSPALMILLSVSHFLGELQCAANIMDPSLFTSDDQSDPAARLHHRDHLTLGNSPPPRYLLPRAS
jgi:hypothetical protein